MPVVRRLPILAVVSLTLFLFFENRLVGGAVEGFIYKQIDAAWVGEGRSRYTEVYGVNNAGDMVGIVLDVVDEGGGSQIERYRGFALTKGGFSAVAPPGATYSEARGISRSGDIVGTFLDDQGQYRSFLFSRGSYSQIEFPGALYTTAFSIAEDRDIAGDYQLDDRVLHGFVLSEGVYTSVDVPNAIQTRATAVNNSGSVVGYFESQSSSTSTRETSGFALIDGLYKTIQHPRTEVGGRHLATFAADINETQQIVGFFADAQTFRTRGFLLNGDSYSELDVPRAIYTYAFGINDKGWIVGSFVDRDNAVHGFIAKQH